MRRFALMAGLAMLAACSSEKSTTFETEDGEATATVDSDDGTTTASITTDEGTVHMRSGANVAVDLPMGFSAYPRAKVVSNTVIDKGDGKGTLVLMETGDSLDDVTSYYRSQAETAGIKIELQLSTDEGRMLAGSSGDEAKSFSLNASRADDKTTITLMVGDKLD